MCGHPVKLDLSSLQLKSCLSQLESRCLKMYWGGLNVCIYFLIFFVGPSGPQMFWAVRIMRVCYSMQQPAVLLKPGALGLFLIPQHCHSAAFPEHLGEIKEQEQQQFQGMLGYVRSVQVCFICRISGNEVAWAAVPLSSRDGDKSWIGNLELLEGYVWNGTKLPIWGIGFLVWLERHGLRQQDVNVTQSCSLMKAGPDVEFAPFQQLMSWKIIQVQFSVSFKVLASWVWVIISLGTICPCPLLIFLLFRVKGFFSLFWMGGTPSAYFPEILGMLNMVHDCTEECSRALTSWYHGSSYWWRFPYLGDV